MIVVRRTLTELLLEVTNEEISKVADETIKTFKSKGNYLFVSTKRVLLFFSQLIFWESVSLTF